jgi:hypothetical protein
LLAASQAALLLRATHGTAAAERAPATGWSGGLDGVWHWRLPDTPNGLRPTQSWHATGAAPDGTIYVGGMDHATNSALYRLEPRRGVLRLVGDARSASEAAGNWQPGETAEKFHTRPLWHDGKVYVASMDRSTMDDAYLSRRGFHWYAYDPARDSFRDLSAAEPGGTGAPHGGLVTLAADPARNLIYGAGVPTGEIFRYDVARGRTQNLGRPPSFDRPYVYTNRMMWVDSRGRLHFTAGGPDPSIYGHVHTWDPDRGFGERRDWPLQGELALEVGQWMADRKTCFLADAEGHVYRFGDEGPSWSYLGKADLPRFLWVFHVSAGGEKAWLATSQGRASALYEFDLAAGRTRRLCALAELGADLAGLDLHTGYDAWDGEGRFYFTSFSSAPGRGVLVTRVDPLRVEAALGRRTKP